MSISLTADDLLAVADALRQSPRATVVDGTDIGATPSSRGPQLGSLPAARQGSGDPNPHPKGSPERRSCKGECGQYGHGVHDATTDLGVIAYWWGVRYPGANIGARVPENMFVIDIDPRSSGHESLAALLLDHGPLPETMTTISGRCDGGSHRASTAGRPGSSQRPA